MSVVAKFIRHSVGKKFIMGITGLAMCGFMVAHLSGNLLLFAGADQFNAYAIGLHKIPGFLFIELGLAVTFIVHTYFALVLVRENAAARPQQYIEKKSMVKGSFASNTMRFTGPYILFFVIFHLLNIKFRILPSVDAGLSAYDGVNIALENPLVAIFYTISAVIVGVHLKHGLQSSVQSLGLMTEQSQPTLQLISNVYGALIGFGFAILPLFMLTK